MNNKELIKITATYKIVTPLFIGDANHKAHDISPASIKGVLRFWWRALNWGRIKSEVQSETVALQRLHFEESTIFGSADGNIGQASFLLRVYFKNSKGVHNDWPSSTSHSGYIGIGLWESGNKENGNYKAAREYINEDQDFSIELICKPNFPTDAIEQLNDVLKAWGYFGGLGSRGRRGFGSVSIEKLNDASLKFNKVTAYQNAVTELLERYRLRNIDLPPFTAFCKDSLFCVSEKTILNARSAHAELGKAFKNYRGQPSELRGSKKRVFGMPYSGGGQQEADARRSSPLLFHIHPIDSAFIDTVLFMPAIFHYEPALNSVDYSLASGFLSALDKAVLI
ncbi:MAG: type III-B CRISPR module RAMP protein Cmr1 [Gammaproteobacteria bacterium]